MIKTYKIKIFAKGVNIPVTRVIFKFYNLEENIKIYEIQFCFYEKCRSDAP
jgi:hypothetical protein